MSASSSLEVERDAAAPAKPRRNPYVRPVLITCVCTGVLLLACIPYWTRDRDNNKVSFELPAEDVALSDLTCSSDQAKTILDEAFEGAIVLDDWKTMGHRVRYMTYAEGVNKAIEDLREQCTNNPPDEPKKGTSYESLNLQIGWFIYWVIIMAFFPCWLGLIRIIQKRCAVETEEQMAEYVRRRETDACIKTYEILSGSGPVGIILNCIIILVALLNFYTFAVHTEGMNFPDTKPNLRHFGIRMGDAETINQWVTYISWGLFALITMLRLIFIKEDIFWGQFDRLSPFIYIVGNVYIQLEILALSVTFTDLLRNKEEMDWNFLFLFSFRFLEMFERNCSRGSVLNKMGRALAKHKWRLLVPYIVNFCIWFTFGGIHYAANSSEHAPEKYPDDAIWDPYVFKTEPGEDAQYEGWHKFQSIPSCMYFVLHNLAKEVPLADAYTKWRQRIVLSLILFAILPMFAMPIGVLETVLLSCKDAEDEDKDRPVEPAGGNHILRHESDYWKAIITTILASVPILLYIDVTMEGTEHKSHRIFGVQPKSLAMVDLLVGFMFAFELAANFKHGLRYVLSSLFVIDIMSVVPGIFHGVVAVWVRSETFSGRVNDMLAACMLFRLLKLERYTYSFGMIFQVFSRYEGLMMIALLLTGVLWMFFSVVFYKAERGNPDPELQEYYGSILRSGWAEIIQLHGEFPWCDYMTFSRTLCAVTTYVATVIFLLPVSLSSGGFKELVLDEDLANGVDDVPPWPKGNRPDEEYVWTRSLYDILYAHLLPEPPEDNKAKAVKWTSHILTALCLVVGVLGSVSDQTLEEKFGPGFPSFFKVFGWTIDILCFTWFILVLVSQVVCFGIAHFSSFSGMSDILSLCAIFYTFSIDRAQRLRWDYDNKSTMLEYLPFARILRLAALDYYYHAFYTVSMVVSKNGARLLKATYALFTTWFFHAFLLFIFETDRTAHQLYTEIKEKDVKGSRWPDTGPERMEFQNHVYKGFLVGDVDDGDVTQAERFASLPRALQMSLLHLVGDFPTADYCFPSKVVHYVGIVFGIAIVGSYIGLCSATFVEQIKFVDRKKDHNSALARYMAIRRTLAVLRTGVKRFRERKLRGEILTPGPPKIGFAGLSRSIVVGSTTCGRVVDRLFQANIVFSCVLLFVSTLPELKHKWNPTAQTALLIVELFCTTVYAFEYVVRFCGTPRSPTYKFSFYTWVTVISIPFGYGKVIAGLVNPQGSTFMTVCEGIIAIRIFHILRFPVFGRETYLIKEAILNGLRLLVIPTFLALNVWCWGATLWFLAENGSKNESPSYQEFGTLADALYWSSIFSVGEWAISDFSFLGAIVCILSNLTVLIMFGLPLGIIANEVSAVFHEKTFDDFVLDAIIKGISPDQMLETVTAAKVLPDVFLKSVGMLKDSKTSIPRSSVPGILPSPFDQIGSWKDLKQHYDVGSGQSTSKPLLWGGIKQIPY